MSGYMGKQRILRRRRRRRLIWTLVFFTVAGVILYSASIGLQIFLGTDEDPEATAQPEIPAIIQNDGFITVTLKDSDLHRGNLILVSKAYAFHFSDDMDLVSLYDEKSASYSVAGSEILLCRDVVGVLNSMLDDFNRKTGLKTINIVSGYRSYEYQQELLDDETERMGAVEAARWVAPAGCSEHHTGLAVDFGLYFEDGTSGVFRGTGDYEWLVDNAYQYGFVVRYEKEKSDITGISTEPWHFRYVGIPHAYVMKLNGFCLEEYIDFLRQYPSDGDHLNVQYRGEKYEIFFTDGGDVDIPDGKSYEISGNNVDGWIVTIQEEG